MDAPLISAALIVRNEEKFLAGCLDSLAGFADEIVIVDTGSTDGTRKIAEDRGMTVHSFPWVDDFSAARNRALELATGQWIFYIDADERVRGGAENVRRRLLDPHYLAFQVLLTPKQGVTPYWILRLWRNHPSIRFRGIVHENMWPSIIEYQAIHGGKIRNVRLEMDHLGYDGDVAYKNDRYLPLLERALELDPERIYCWFHLATIKMEQGKPEEAKKAWRTAMNLVRARSHRQQDDSLPWSELIQFDLTQPDLTHPEGTQPAGTRHGGIAELLEEALSKFPNDLQFHWLKGRFLLKQKRFAEAIACFETLAHAGETGNFSHHLSYDLRLLGVQAYENLATCYFRLAQWKDAVRYYDLALGREPGRMDLRAKRAVAVSKAAATPETRTNPDANQ